MPDLFIAKHKKGKETSNKKPETLLPKPPRKLKKVPILTAFTEHPENLEFEHQEPNEKIHLFLRRHLITNLRWTLGSLLGSLIPIGFYFLLPFFATTNLSLPANYLLILITFYYLILFGYAFINFITWYYNVGIVTNLRVIDIDIDYITNKNVAHTGLVDIIDVEYSQSGFLQNLFDYGDVHMQTEGLKANFEFLNIPKPAKTTDVISDLMREARND